MIDVFMHKKFDHKEIEKKWQKKWEGGGLYNIEKRDPSREKEYVLAELPYPSGNLHIGHWFAFAVTDIYVRAHRMQGRQVFFPIGFDAFGLPAENAAIKRNLDPKKWTEENIEHMTEQLKSMGNAFTWNALHRTNDPSYYKWTQWMFTKFFEQGIAYRGKGIVNWCPSCNTVLANEQVINGHCERCDTEVEKREMEEWKLRITDYANRLLDDLEPLDWPEHIKESQRKWIGRSEGAELTFRLSTGDKVQVFTTRPDTLFGVTYMVLAPEHKLIEKNKDQVANWSDVEKYIKKAQKKVEQDRLDETKEKTGVKVEGITAANPGNGEEIPIYIADYVLAHYGTGAIMAVPAHDERDYAFAQKYDIPMRQVVVPCSDDPKNPPQAQFKEVTRDTVIVHLKDKSTGKYAILKWHGSLEGIQTAIMGGIETEQTPEDAVLAEIEEETGIEGVRITHKLRWITAARYCASHKKENRRAHTHAFLAEVDDLSAQKAISEEEKTKHTLTWVEEKQVLENLTPDHQKEVWQLLRDEKPLVGSGYLINSGAFNGMDSENAKSTITKDVSGTFANIYRLRDWSVGRQRYWGAPVPIVYDPDGEPHAVPEEHLPWLLPTDVDFRPTGEPPLAKSRELVERTEKIFGKGWKPEVVTFDTFVDSSWYFLRYLEPHNDKEFTSMDAQKKWMPIDVYFGGAEHTTMHVLYSRFWQKALYDLGLVNVREPYKRRINRGLVLGPDGNKMSKSKGNVIDPDEQVGRLGADTVKMYLAFMGPYGESTNYPWDMGGIAGIRRFLERVNGLSDHIEAEEPEEVTRLLHKTIKKVSEDIERYKFNTAISALMVFVNAGEKNGVSKETYITFLKLLAPFAPHLAEELWADSGEAYSIHESVWPHANPELTKDELVSIGVQINGKLRGAIDISPDATEEEAFQKAKEDARLAGRFGDDTKKIIYVPGKILNVII
jgi:leucyl-tRNA synthetase